MATRLVWSLLPILMVGAAATANRVFDQSGSVVWVWSGVALAFSAASIAAAEYVDKRRTSANQLTPNGLAPATGSSGTNPSVSRQEKILWVILVLTVTIALNSLINLKSDPVHGDARKGDTTETGRTTSSATSETPPTSSSSSATSSTSTTARKPQSTSSSPPARTVSGPILQADWTLGRSTAFDLDTGRSSFPSEGADILLDCCAVHAVDGAVLTVPENRIDHGSDCLAPAVRMNSIALEKLSSDMDLCVATALDNIATVRITSVSKRTTEVVFTYQLWH